MHVHMCIPEHHLITQVSFKCLGPTVRAGDNRRAFISTFEELTPLTTQLVETLA